MADEYAEKMSRKSLSELLLYVHNRGEYREEAILAALDELERRGELPAAAVALRAELRPVVEQQRQQKALIVAVTPAAKVASAQVLAAEEGPALYSPGTIVLFSMLFTFMAGGVLLVINMFRLKESGKALRVALFVMVLLLAYVYGLQWMMVSYKAQIWFFRLAVNLVAILAYLQYFWPRYVGPRPYVNRQWLPAMLICFAISLVVLGALYLLVVPLMTSGQK
ncbi:MAG: hypothetical protein H7Z21_18880 [Hymenobacter sp.]|nr:hypothetical protein [Hymenobacter sp.]